MKCNSSEIRKLHISVLLLTIKLTCWTRSLSEVQCPPLTPDSRVQVCRALPGLGRNYNFIIRTSLCDWCRVCRPLTVTTENAECWVRRVEAATWWLVNRSHAAHIHPQPRNQINVCRSLLLFPVSSSVAIFTESDCITGRFQGPSHRRGCAAVWGQVLMSRQCGKGDICTHSW